MIQHSSVAEGSSTAQHNKLVGYTESVKHAGWWTILLIRVAAVLAKQRMQHHLLGRSLPAA